MRTLKIARVLMGAIFTSLLASAALAQVSPPPWWGTNDGNTTSQSWNFDDPNNPTATTFEVNPFGAPLFGTENDVIYEATALDRTGVFIMRSGGRVIFDIPNDARPDWIKQCWMQFTWAVDGTGSFDIDGAGSTMVNFNRVDEAIPGTPWFTTTVTFDLVPQPPFEIISFQADPNSLLFLDDFHFGSHCVVPEPATMAALGFGALAMLRRRRK